VLRAFGVDPDDELRALAEPALQLAGDALAAGSDGTRTAGEVVHLAAELVRAGAVLLWSRSAGGTLELVGSHGLAEPPPELAAARELAERSLLEPTPLRAVVDDRLPAGLEVAAALPLGQPPVGVL